MSNAIEVGKTYKLLDASKDPCLQEVIDEGYITFPDDGLVTISSVEIHGYTQKSIGYSLTEGLTSSDLSWLIEGKGIVAISQESLNLGAFEEVTDARCATP